MSSPHPPPPGPPPPPEALVGVLAELDRLRALVLATVERSAPQLHPRPPEDAAPRERAAHDLLLDARRAVLGNPTAARALQDLLVAQGHRYATTPDGAALRDALGASGAVDNLRRIWETVTLNVLDGPAPPDTAPDAWAELLADAITEKGLGDHLLGRLRPEGFA